MKKKSELLVPAGSLNKLKTAVLYGADAVYAGTPDLSLRKQAKFTLEELKQAVELIHSSNKKIYLTLNLFAHNKDIPKLPKFLDTIKEVKPDGIIIADPGIFKFVKENAPDIPLHVSTQANVCSYQTVNFWKEQGADMCVLGREVSFAELKEIREKCKDIKLEAFIHGSMCMSYSGRCLISNFLAERASNKGNCAHCCRWKYKLKVRPKNLSDETLTKEQKEFLLTPENKDLFDFFLEEEDRPNEYFPIEEMQYGAYILNSRDLCLMPKLDEMLSLGIESLKIEGRNKTDYYAAGVTRAYRHAIDSWYKNPEDWDYKPYLKELLTVSNRGFTYAFHEGNLTHHANNYERTKSASLYKNAGVVIKWEGKNNDKNMILELRNYLKENDEIELLSPYMLEPIKLKLTHLIDAETDTKAEKLSAGQEQSIKIPLKMFAENSDFKGNIEDLERLLPQLSIARKKAEISETEKDILKNYHEFEIKDLL